MESIKLENAEWQYDPERPLGPEGGFGIVYEGTGKGHQKVAVKKLKISAKEAAHRELNIASKLIDQELNCVIPVLDSGQDANSGSYFIVMALAEKSLQDDINSRETFSDIDTARILIEIANGLSEVDEIVHRDLKPGNVLFHETKWKIADFGIARFVEDSTSLRTLKDYLTPDYAAPEQWNFEHATSATDIYALGCIGYTLLTGKPPFPGPIAADFQQQHLSESPPQLNGHLPKLRSLLIIMLRKPPEVRPDVGRVIEILNDIIKNNKKDSLSEGLNALAKAGAESAARQAEAEALIAAQKAERDKRKQIADGAIDILKDLMDKFIERIKAQVSHVICSGGLPNITLSVESTRLVVKNINNSIPKDAFPQSGWDVVSGVNISVRQNCPITYSQSSSLWYSKITPNDKYRWREVSYRMSGLIMYDNSSELFALNNPHEADRAACSAMDTLEIAFGPVPVDDENFDEFCDRWAKNFAKAIDGRLRS